MNCWEILGIEPTTEKKTIKLAYSSKLKSMDHEKEIMRFQQLRQAYENALAYSSRTVPAALPEIPLEEDALGVNEDDKPQLAIADLEIAEPEPVAFQTKVFSGLKLSRYPMADYKSLRQSGPADDGGLSPDAFLERCKALYQSNYKTRYAGHEWTQLVTDEKNAGLKYHKQLSLDVFRFVTAHTDFSPGVLRQLDFFFSWSDNESYWASRVPNMDFDIFLLKIKKGLFSFDSFDFDAKIDFDRYFFLRERLYKNHMAFIRVKSKDNSRALKQTLRELHRIYARDSGLSNLRRFALYDSLASFFKVDKRIKIRRKNNWVFLLAFALLANPATMLVSFLTLAALAVLWGIWIVVKKFLKGMLSKYKNLCSLY